MPHHHKRHILPEVLRKLKFSPVVSLQGPRQCGKSFFARELLQPHFEKFLYVTLDFKEQRAFAQTNPGSFLARYEDKAPLAIDEVQKAPDLFDEIKASVDQHRVPGKFLLLGSTEFSREALVRESLTGRLTRCRLFPMNLAEACEIDLNQKSETQTLNLQPRVPRKQLLQFLDQGGFPGIFAVRSQIEREQKLQEWIEVTVYRDLLQFPQGGKIVPELAFEILEALAKLETPSATEVKRKTGKDLRMIKRHLDLLTQLFVISPIDPHPLGTGSRVFLICDPGIAARLGANFQRLLETWSYLELQSQANSHGLLGLQRKVTYYRSSKGAWVNFIVEAKKERLILDIHPAETWVDQDVRALRACAEKLVSSEPSIPTTLAFLHGGREAFKEKVKKLSISFCPWESIA